MIVHIFINNSDNFEFLYKKLFILKDNYMHKHKRTIEYWGGGDLW